MDGGLACSDSTDHLGRRSSYWTIERRRSRPRLCLRTRLSPSEPLRWERSYCCSSCSTHRRDGVDAERRGYWMVGADGGVFSFGDARFYGLKGEPLNSPWSAWRRHRAVAVLAGAADGGVFSFGDARYWGSTGHIVLNKPVVGMAATPNGGVVLAGCRRRRGLQLRGRQVLGQHGRHRVEQARGRHGEATPNGGVLAGGGRRRSVQLRGRQVLGQHGHIVLNKPVVGMAATGRWRVLAGGGRRRSLQLRGATFYGQRPGASPAARPSAWRRCPAGVGTGWPSGRRSRWQGKIVG